MLVNPPAIHAAWRVQDAAASTLSPATEPEPERTPSAAAQRERAREQAEDSLRRTLVPQAMDAKRFGTILSTVDQTLLANKDIAEAFVRYQETVGKLSDDPGRRIRQLLPAAYTFDGARRVFVARATPELVEILALRDKAMTTAAAAERALFRSIELATPIEHRSKLAFERIADLNERMSREGLLPSTAISLGDILSKLKLAEDVRGMIAPSVLAYAENLVGLLRDRARLLRDNDAARAAIETSAGTLWRFGLPDRVTTIDEQLVAIEDSEFANEILIRDAHLEGLRRLRVQLPRQAGRKLVEEWQRSVHPELFDDERILNLLVESVIARPEFDATVDQAVLDALDVTYQRIEPLAESACIAADGVLPRLLDRTTQGISGEISARLALLDAQKKRRAALKESLARIRAITGSAPTATLARFDDLSETILALERADRFERSSLEALQAEILLAESDAPSSDSTGLDVGATDAPARGGPTSQTPAASPSAPRTNPATPESGSSSGGSSSKTSRGSRGSRKSTNN